MQKLKLVNSFRKCHGRKPVGIYWYNLSDLRDKIAVNYKLEDDFKENARHVRPEDMIVVNNYEYGGEKNPHKSFGYLRTPEVTGIIEAFLES